MFRHFSLIFRNCFRNRRRSILTVISIAASLCLLGMLLTIYHTFFYTEATPDQALRLITKSCVSLANLLPLSYQQQIKQTPGVKKSRINQWFSGVYKDSRDPANFCGFAVEAIKKPATIESGIKLPESEQQRRLHRSHGYHQAARRLFVTT